MKKLFFIVCICLVVFVFKIFADVKPSSDVKPSANVESQEENNETTYEMPRLETFTTKDLSMFPESSYFFAEQPSGSMENTIMVGERLVVHTDAYLNNRPNRFDVIVFKSTDNKNIRMVKRIIGLPGETLEIKDGAVYINSSVEPLSEPYIKASPDQSDFEQMLLQSNYGPYEIPQNHYFVMGDNRVVSNDSRRWENKYVPIDNVIGKVAYILEGKKQEATINPITFNSDLMLPLREVLENLNYKIDWEEIGHAVMAIEDKEIKLYPYENKLSINGKEEDIEKQFIIKDDHIYVDQNLLQRILSRDIPYTVKVGDSLRKISEKCYGSAEYIDLIKDANGMENNNIRAGATLRIPQRRGIIITQLESNLLTYYQVEIDKDLK